MTALYIIAYIFVWLIVTTIAMKTKWGQDDEWLSTIMGLFWPATLVVTLAIGIGMGISNWVNG